MMEKKAQRSTRSCGQDNNTRLQKVPAQVNETSLSICERILYLYKYTVSNILGSAKKKKKQTTISCLNSFKVFKVDPQTATS